MVTWKTNLVYGYSMGNIKLESEWESKRGGGGILEKLILKCSARNEDTFLRRYGSLCCPPKGETWRTLRTRKDSRAQERAHAPRAIFSWSKLDSHWSRLKAIAKLYPRHAKYIHSVHLCGCKPEIGEILIILNYNFLMFVFFLVHLFSAKVSHMLVPTTCWNCVGD